MTPGDKIQKINSAVRPVLNGLHSREGLSVMDINAALFGLVTCSMGQDIGVDAARDFIISAMDNVWGKPKRKRWWQR